MWIQVLLWSFYWRTNLIFQKQLMLQSLRNETPSLCMSCSSVWMADVISNLANLHWGTKNFNFNFKVCRKQNEDDLKTWGWGLHSLLCSLKSADFSSNDKIIRFRLQNFETFFYSFELSPHNLQGKPWCIKLVNELLSESCMKRTNDSWFLIEQSF